jgi:hypothetical protein
LFNLSERETIVIENNKQICIDFPLIGTTVYYVEHNKMVEDVITKLNIEITENSINYKILSENSGGKWGKKVDRELFSDEQVIEINKGNIKYEFRGDGWYLYEKLMDELPENFFFYKEECIEYYNNKMLEEFKSKLI